MTDSILENLLDVLIKETTPLPQYEVADKAWQNHLQDHYTDALYSPLVWKNVGNGNGYEKVGNIENVIKEYKMGKYNLRPNSKELNLIRESDLVNLYRDTLELMNKSLNA